MAKKSTTKTKKKNKSSTNSNKSGHADTKAATRTTLTRQTTKVIGGERISNSLSQPPARSLTHLHTLNTTTFHSTTNNNKPKINKTEKQVCSRTMSNVPYNKQNISNTRLSKRRRMQTQTNEQMSSIRTYKCTCECYCGFPVCHCMYMLACIFHLFLLCIFFGHLPPHKRVSTSSKRGISPLLAHFI